MKNSEEETSEAFVKDKIIIEKDTYRIALVFPSKIVGKYAKDVINTTIAYMLHNNIKFQFEVFDSVRQNEFDINRAFDEVKKAKFDNAIVLYTQDALNDLAKVEGIEDLSLYLPLVNINDSKQ